MNPVVNEELRPGTIFPDPFIVAPLSGNHKHSLILLHGGGLTGKVFGEELLKTSMSQFQDLQTAFPDAKFIFPTATEQKAVGLGIVNCQFFDLFSTKDLDENDYVQFDGLRDSVNYIHDLMRVAVDEVGPLNVVIGGLSQGCAVSLFSLLLWEGPPFAAIVGIAGWLPLRRRILDCWKAAGLDGTHEDRAKLQEAISCLRETINVPSKSVGAESVLSTIPIFIGHGLADKDLPCTRARPTHSLLIAMGLAVQLEDYEELQHWFSGDMLHDIVIFLNEKSQFGRD